MLDPVPEHVDDAALGNFTLKAVEELLPVRAVLRNLASSYPFGLRGFEKAHQLRQVYGVVAVIVVGVTGDVTGFVAQKGDNQRLQPLFARVSRHVTPLRNAASPFAGAHPRLIAGSRPKVCCRGASVLFPLA